MKFLVKRTSTGWLTTYNDPPCDGAVLLNPDREEGEMPAWGIEIESLEALVAFMESVKHPVIISEPFGKSDYADVELEIYDDYRE